MRFTSIKSNGKRVHLEWTTPAEKDPDAQVAHTLESKQPPAPEFTAALQAFRGEVGTLLELPKSWMEQVNVTGLSINYEDDGRQGLIVTFTRPLDRTNSPVLVNTPHLREASDEETGCYLPDAMIELLKEVEIHAAAYVDGTRAQGELFSEAKAE